MIRSIFLTLAVLASPLHAADLVGYWTFDSENYEDLSSQKNDGYSAGLVSFTEDVPVPLGKGRALEFDGKSRVVIPHSPALDSLDEMTISTWIKFGPTQIDDFPAIIAKFVDNGQPGWRVGTWRSEDPAIIRFAAGRPTDLSDGDWHHLAWVVTAEGVSTYLDGNLVGHHNPPPESKSPIQNTADIVLGARDTNRQYRPFVGAVDNLAIFKVALSVDQVNALSTGIAPDQLH